MGGRDGGREEGREGGRGRDGERLTPLIPGMFNRWPITGVLLNIKTA